MPDPKLTEIIGRIPLAEADLWSGIEVKTTKGLVSVSPGVSNGLLNNKNTSEKKNGFLVEILRSIAIVLLILQCYFVVDRQTVAKFDKGVTAVFA